MFTRPLALGLAALATTTVAGAALAAPAGAATLAKGRVTAVGGLASRAWPTTASATYGAEPEGKVVTLLCKVRGSEVDGNGLWYQIPSEGVVWLSARYVANVGPAPRYCNGGAGDHRGRTTATLTKRASTTTAAAAVGSVPNGTTISLVCRLDGQSIGGNPRWYYTQDGRWISARYVTNLGAAPSTCL